MAVRVVDAARRQWRSYTGSFWAANVSELFERIAYYGMTSLLVVYLTEARGFADSTAILISGNFSAVTFGLAAVSGFLADMLGYRRAMMMAYAMLATGYFLAGQMTHTGAILASLLLIAVGASLIKPVITGTVQKTCSDANRAIGFSIYYTLVNIGGALGPNLSAQMSERFGVARIFLVSGVAACVALLLAIFAYREPPAVVEGSGPAAGDKRTIVQFFGDFLRVISNVRLVLLFVFVAGWWSMFWQFLNVLPLYLTDDLKVSGWKLGFILGLDAVAVVALQVAVGFLVRNMRPFRAVLLALLISTGGVALMGVYPAWVFAAAGVALFAVGEIIYSAHFYRYLGNMAPPNQVGMYMGFAFLPIALGSLLSGIIGGPVAAYFREELHASQMMWFAFAAVGLISAAGLLVLTLTHRSDPSKQAVPQES